MHVLFSITFLKPSWAQKSTLQELSRQYTVVVLNEMNYLGLRKFTSTVEIRWRAIFALE